MDNTAIGNNELFFELLCVAIGTRKTLSITPSAEQWTELFALSKKQALVAITFAGLTKYLESLGEASPYAGGVRGSMLYLKWLGLTAKIASRNKLMNEECAKVCKDLVHDGFKTVVLKGQSNLEYYPEELRECRTPGDIDVWVRPFEETLSIPLKGGSKNAGIEIAVTDLDGKGAHYERFTGKAAVVEYARMCARVKGVNDDLLVRYHHVDMPVSDSVEVEAHFMPMYLNNPFLNRRLQEFFELYGDPIEQTLSGSPLEGESIPAGTASFNAVYQLTHIYKHLFEEGIGLRQLLDYYFVLRALHIEQGTLADSSPSMAQWAEGMGISVMSNIEIQHVLKRCGLMGLAGAVMYVLREVFEDPLNPPEGGNQKYADWQTRWPWMICEPDEKRGKHLLDEIMLAGNFGKYDSRKGDLSNESSLHKFLRKTKRNIQLAKYYPHEALWEPFFRIYHWFWRRFELWRW